MYIKQPVSSMLIFFVVAIFSIAQVHASKPHFDRVVGKPQAPVSIQYQLGEFQPGTPAQVNLSIINGIDVDSMTVDSRLSNGLQSADMQSQYHYGVMAAKEISVISFSINAQYHGRFRIYITITINANGVSQSSSQVVPIVVGNASDMPLQRKTTGQLRRESTGQRIIAMPAKAVGRNNSQTTEPQNNNQ